MSTRKTKWRMLACSQVDATLSNAEEYAFAEFEIDRHRYLTRTDLDEMLEEAMSELDDDGEVELEWAIAPALSSDKSDSPPKAIIEMAIVETTLVGRKG